MEENVTRMLESIADECIKGIIADLKVVIDQIDMNFANAKSLIHELARRLDESKQCEQSQICISIKQILEDKIKEGKITEKWIEDCLPKEYKRKYTNKSELTSLSKHPRDKEAKVSCNQADGATAATVIQKVREGDSNDEEENTGITNDQGSYYDEERYGSGQLTNKIMESKEEPQLVRSTREYYIPKEKHNQVIVEIQNSKEMCYVIFDDGNRKLVSIESDISREKKRGISNG
jgi:hypothetical protein